MQKLGYINLYTTDPSFNLAAEQYVFDSLPKDRMWFMLWQNDNAVIIGKYQNALAEIDLPYVEEHGIRVVRRLSGGGAVYHDLGNLNFTFVADAGDMEQLNMRIFCEPIVRALGHLGVSAQINGRNDITIDGKKFSGNSQYLRCGRVMHHGTIMFDSNLDVVTKALKVDPTKIESKGIKSVRSRVTNIRPYLPGSITLGEFRRALLGSILEDTPGEEYSFTEDELSAIRAIAEERYGTWEWNFGRSPECTIKKAARIPGCGKVEAYISADHGVIRAVSFSGDFFSTADPAELAQNFIGRIPDREGYLAALSGADVSKYFTGLEKEQLLALLES